MIEIAPRNYLDVQIITKILTKKAPQKHPKIPNNQPNRLSQNQRTMQNPIILITISQ